MHAALTRLDPLWDELFPAEQARIVTLLVERVEIGVQGLSVRLRMDGLAGLVREMATDIGEAPHDPRHPDPRHRHHPRPVPHHQARRAEGDAAARGRASVAQDRLSTLVKALARAFRWKRMLDSGEFATIAELAACEGIAPSYMTRILRMTLLAPDIVEAILDEKRRHR